MNNSKIIVSALIQAPLEKVWDSYTNPQHIVNWNFADPSWHCPKAENDMKVGGTYKARMEAKDDSFGFDFEAVYTEIKELESFDYRFDNRMASVQFGNKGKQTEIVVSFDPENENPIELQKGGWQSILNNFKTYTESI